MKVFLFGVPNTIGGATVESGDSVLLWKRMGVDVTVIHLLSCSCKEKTSGTSWEWMERLEEAGIEIHSVAAGNLASISGLAGSIVVDFCNHHAAHCWAELRGMGCKLIHSPCMTFPAMHEYEAFCKTPPTAIHFQSRFQMGQLWPTYEAKGCRINRRIPGAFEPLPFRPMRPRGNDVFSVGRLARPCRTKWPTDLWYMLGMARKELSPRGIDLRGICMGWNKEVEFHCGVAPEWAATIPPDCMAACDFLSVCHVLICANWGAMEENWPRVGLEAMAAGVPILADCRGGWCEMIEHGVSGLLCHGPSEFVDGIVELARNEDRRQALIKGGRARLTEIADQERIGLAWLDFFREVNNA